MIDEHASTASQPRPNDGVTSDPAADSRARRERESLRLRELIDFGEGRLNIPVLDAAGMAELFRSSHRIAMIGASSNPTRPSNGVFRYLRAVGYDVVPVSPTETGVE